jgi:tetratricopeptide (TPR) repeat protein
MRRWSLFAGTLGVLALSFWTGCSNPNLAGGKLHFDQATRIEDAKEKTARFERARDTFAQACKEMPKSAEARLWLAKTYAELDKPDSAAIYFDQAASLDNTPPFTKELGDARAHYWSVKYTNGQTSALNAAKAKNKGDDKTAKEEFTSALGQLRQAATYGPDSSQTYSMMATVYLNLASMDSAIVMLKKAQTVAPKNEKVADQLFAVYRKGGDDAYGMGADAEKAAADNSRQGGPSDSTAAKKPFETALEFYKNASALHPDDPDLNFQLGATSYELSLLDKGNQQQYLDQSVGYYNAVLKSNPADVDVLYNLALVYLDTGKYNDAETLASRLVDLNPREPSYHNLLGRVKDKLGDKAALSTGIVFARALRSGETHDPGEAQKMAEKYGSSNDLRRRYLQSGAPDQIFSFQDTGGQNYDVWFYWTRGVGYGFLEGKERFTTSFAPDGVLQLTGGDAIGTRGASKVISGSVANSSSHTYDYVRVEEKLFDENGDEIKTVAASTNKLEPHGTWSFEIPVTDDQAVRVTPAQVRGY